MVKLRPHRNNKVVGLGKSISDGVGSDCAGYGVRDLLVSPTSPTENSITFQSAHSTVAMLHALFV